MLESVALPNRRGYPRARPRELAGDKGYSTVAIRAWCQRHHVHAVIPERRDQVAQRAHRRGRKPRFEPATYRRRNIIERVVGWLKHLRRLAMRAEKLASHFRAMVALALTVRYASRYLSDTT